MDAEMMWFLLGMFIYGGSAYIFLAPYLNFRDIMIFCVVTGWVAGGCYYVLHAI